MRSHIAARTVTLALAAALIAVSAPSLSSTPTSAAGTAHIRVLHASPDAPAVEVFVDGKKAVATLAYPQATGFVALPAGSHHIQVFPAGATYAMAGGVINAPGVTLKAGAYYTIAAIGTLKTIRTQILVDSAMMSSKKATVRFAHFSATAPAVTIEAKGVGTIFGKTAFPSATAYITVPGGSYTLIVHPAGSKAAVLTVPGVAFKAGHVYTVYAIGLLSGTGAQKLSATVTDDTTMM